MSSSSMDGRGGFPSPLAPFCGSIHPTFTPLTALSFHPWAPSAALLAIQPFLSSSFSRPRADPAPPFPGRSLALSQFSPLLQNDESYMLISSCKDGQPMLRDWTGDWVGTFLGELQLFLPSFSRRSCLRRSGLPTLNFTGVFRSQGSRLAEQA